MTEVSLAARRKRELDIKLSSLEDDFKTWTTRTEAPSMRRHYSQVKRLTRTLEALLGTMTSSDEWKKATDEDVLAKAVTWEKRVLSAHAIWEVFRNKWMQRSEPAFQEPLFAYDDLAWACYKPAMDEYASEPKEPPLVYLNSTWSAFLRRRDTSFDKEVMSGKDAGAAVAREEYQDTLKRLPIPLLGLPWFQISHPPSALLIAHEVGHAVEFDFGLSKTITGTIDAAGLSKTPQWLDCASEVFADLYGCLCLGGYFAGALLDLIAADRDVVAADEYFGSYPPRTFRVELAIAALTALGLDAASARIRDTWETAYGAKPLTGADRDDVARLVAAIYDPGGMHLRRIIVPPAVDVAQLAAYAGQGNKTEVERHTDARVLFCALRHVYERGTPAEYRKASPLLRAQVVHGYTGAFRSRGGPVPARTDVDAMLAQSAAADAAAGKALEVALGLE